MEKVEISTMAVVVVAIVLTLIFWGIPAAEKGAVAPVWILLGVTFIGAVVGGFFSLIKIYIPRSRKWK